MLGIVSGDLFFWLSKILWFLSAPINLWVTIIIIGTVLLWTRWYAGARLLITMAMLIGFVVGSVHIRGPAIAYLEDRFPPPAEMPDYVDGIIVLGGQIAVDSGLKLDKRVTRGISERMLAFAKLAKRYPNAKLVFTGGSGSLFQQELKEAHFVPMVVRSLGLDPNRIILEDQSRNTYENAALSWDLIRPGKDERWFLITSASHMPRAVGCFRKVRWNVVPYPVDYTTEGGEEVSFSVGLLGGLSALGEVLHEWIGLVAYWVTGKTNTLFPSPG